LAAIAEITGGLLLQPLSESDMTGAFETDAMMQLSARASSTTTRVVGAGGSGHRDRRHLSLPNKPEFASLAKTKNAELRATLQTAREVQRRQNQEANQQRQEKLAADAAAAAAAEEIAAAAVPDKMWATEKGAGKKERLSTRHWLGKPPASTISSSAAAAAAAAAAASSSSSYPTAAAAAAAAAPPPSSAAAEVNGGPCAGGLLGSNATRVGGATAVLESLASSKASLLREAVQPSEESLAKIKQLFLGGGGGGGDMGGMAAAGAGQQLQLPAPTASSRGGGGNGGGGGGGGQSGRERQRRLMHELRRCIVSEPHAQLVVAHDVEDVSVWQAVLSAPDDATVRKEKEEFEKIRKNK
jgi:hypothetical protein